MKYQINPITVDAIQIAGVGDHLSDGSIRVLLEGEGPTSHGTVVKRHEMMGLPKVGDYYVTNEDGTHNLVPRAAFEATHTLVDTVETDAIHAETKDHAEAEEGQLSDASEGQQTEDLGDDKLADE